jgi:hypothetical protein
MRKTHHHRGTRRLLLAVASLPLFASTCAERTVDFVLGRDFLDDRSNAEQAEDILDDIGDLFDDVF